MSSPGFVCYENRSAFEGLTDLSWSSHIYLNADLVPFAPPPSIDQNSKILLTAPLLYDVYPPLKFSVPHA